jgi:bidirectional [NiFe] hydrogenase diaphorase subunit
MHIIKICMGSSCCINFGLDNLAIAEKTLGIKAGETTPDGKFRLEKTGCLSHCEDAPNVMFLQQTSPLSLIMMDGTVDRHMLPHHLEKKLKKLKEQS